MPCLDDNAVVRLLGGTLSEEERARFDQHIDGCASCRALVTDAGRALNGDNQQASRGPAAELDSAATQPAGPDSAQDPSGLDLHLVEALAGPASQLLEAGLLVDHFEVIRLLGTGGMGEVYLARDTKLGRKVALKMIRPALLDSPEALARFQREAQAMARFQHPHLLTIYAVGEHEQLPYVAIEYVEGADLDERLAERSMGLDEALRIGIAVAEALIKAHQSGVLHRDLKPQNVLLSNDGRILVADFGLAKLIESDSMSVRHPRLVEVSAVAQSNVLGSPRYMAPEQWQQDELGPATDVWALGSIMFELISGRPPFAEQQAEEQRRAVCSDTIAPRLEECCEVSRPIADLVARCLEKDPANRPTAEALLADLRAVAHQVSISDMPPDAAPTSQAEPGSQDEAQRPSPPPAPRAPAAPPPPPPAPPRPGPRSALWPWGAQLNVVE